MAVSLRLILVSHQTHLNMKKHTLTIALLATMTMSSCSLFRHIEGPQAGKPQNWHDVHRGDQRFIAILTGFTVAFIIGFIGSQTDLMIKR